MSEKINNLALRRSIFFPSAEIYSNAPSGFFDFGPIGESIRRKVIDFWRRELVKKEGFLEIYGSQIMPKDVFLASGHLIGFSDPVAACRKCNSVFRADKLVEEKTRQVVPESLSDKEFDELIEKNRIVCSKCKNKLEKVKRFNMMMKTMIGALNDIECYLRPETCQSIFLDFSRLMKTMRTNLPLGIAQTGAAFRNEISPRNMLLREREIGQMEIEIFFNPEKINEIEKFEEIADYKISVLRVGKKEIEKIKARELVEKKIVSGKLIAYYLARVQQLYEKYGFGLEKMRFRELEKEARAFYAKETWDFEVLTEDGWIELIANNYRTDYDLTGHMKQSKANLMVKEDGKEFAPHVFEISTGIDRTVYAILDNSCKEEEKNREKRIFTSLPIQIAPFITGIYPLVNKDGLNEKAKKVFNELEEHSLDVFFDDSGSIGKRYARADEIGIAFGITIDYDSLKDNSATIRERDSMRQKRIKLEKLPELLWKLQLGKTTFEEL